MIAYTMVGCNDMPKAHEFYNALFAGTSVKPLFKTPHGGQFYGKGNGSPMVCVGFPYNEEAATVGNGGMIAISCDSTEEVDAYYKKAIELGGSDEGEPGWRLENVFYGAYFRDLDGNKLCFCKMNMG